MEQNDNLLRKILAWIQSPNNHVQTSAGLMLGNYARSGELITCLWRM